MLGTLIPENAIITVSYNIFDTEEERLAHEKWQRGEFDAIDLQKASNRINSGKYLTDAREGIENVLDSSKDSSIKNYAKVLLEELSKPQDNNWLFRILK